MKYPFDTSEQLVFDFEKLLNENGLKIESGSDLQKISIAVLETNAKHKKEIVHDNTIDIRDVFSDVAGLIEIISKIVKHKGHKDFNQLIPHLQLLNTSSSAVLTTKSKVTDDGNNKLFELYIALLCMDFSDKIILDDPKNAKGDNPDILFDYKGKRWAIACKAQHSKHEKTLYDNIKKGNDQINVSAAERGLVIVNFKNIIDRNEIWPIINPEEIKKGEEPLFGCFPSAEIPAQMLKGYGETYHKKLVETIEIENLLKLSEKGKVPNAFLIFLQALTSVKHNGNCPPTILKTFNLVSFDNVDEEYIEVMTNLNRAMHNMI